MSLLFISKSSEAEGRAGSLARAAADRDEAERSLDARLGKDGRD